MRQKTLSGLLAWEVAWRFLLELYLAHLEKKPIIAFDLERMTGTSSATTARWLQVLEQRGLITRNTAIDHQIDQPICISETAINAIADIF
jgi:CTP-dependent riboflavin kinase